MFKKFLTWIMKKNEERIILFWAVVAIATVAFLHWYGMKKARDDYNGGMDMISPRSRIDEGYGVTIMQKTFDIADARTDGRGAVIQQPGAQTDIMTLRPHVKAKIEEVKEFCDPGTLEWLYDGGEAGIRCSFHGVSFVVKGQYLYDVAEKVKWTLHCLARMPTDDLDIQGEIARNGGEISMTTGFLLE